jgi:mannosyltransferase OCH1-like enzyme
MGNMESLAPLKIPRIIHQTWKTPDLPDKWQPLQQSWKEKHPTWEYRFTTDADNRHFFEQNYPGFLPVYDAYPLDINRAEAYRYFAMYHYGGVYVDMDFEALRPIDELLRDRQIVFGFEPASHVNEYMVQTRGLKQIVCNAFLASVPHHPFWEHVQKLLIENRHAPTLFDATSIFLLTRAWATFPEPSQVTIVPSEWLYPIDHHEYLQGITREQILTHVTPQTYAIHHWHGSWWRDALFESTRRRILDARQKK